MYVVSLKRVVNYLGERLKDDEQYFEYMQFDRYAGSMSTGYPCFGDLIHAERYDSVDEAKQAFIKNFNGLKSTTTISHYDMSTLAVRKVTFHTKEKLRWDMNV